jgi:hypothetical protein
LSYSCICAIIPNSSILNMNIYAKIGLEIA